MKQLSLILFGILFFSINAFSQKQNDEVLFSVGGESIPVSEFLYIYQKNLGDNADFSRKSLEEYLDLYSKFKLKVMEARRMKLDTFPSFKQEMRGYREQLAKSYLVDKEVKEKLILEAYERMKKDLNVSHIMINGSTDSEQDADAKRRIDNIYNELQSGRSFKTLVKKFSEDRYSSRSGGNLGWVSAMLPEGFYNFENVIYSLKKGEYSKPFKTKFGYHIAMLNDERPARGEIEASHILIREKTKKNKTIKARFIIDSLYNLLLAGADFKVLARANSMDSYTAKKGGYLGFFGINKYDTKFEDVAFGLKNDGDISKPFKSSLGWHIIKRISKSGIKSYDKVKKKLSSKINKNERYDIARKSLILRIRKEAGFHENNSTLTYFAGLLDKSFYTFKWKAPDFEDRVLFTIGNKQFMLNDFVKYCKKNQRARLRLNKKDPLEKSIKSIYTDFLNDSCIKYEEEHLEDKYPDFRFLMKEYTEGNLLFEVMEKEIWNKASQDTTGLKKFFENSDKKYNWKQRAELYEYTIHSDNKKLIKKILKYCKKKNHDKLIKKFNKKKPVITFKIDKVEIGDKMLEGMKFKVNEMSKPVHDEKMKFVTFKKIHKILPAKVKSLNEAKGYIIADYQEYLEKKWIVDLEKKYPIKLNKKVFEKIVK